jgi:hypothetical protein
MLNKRCLLLLINLNNNNYFDNKMIFIFAVSIVAISIKVKKIFHSNKKSKSIKYEDNKKEKILNCQNNQILELKNSNNNIKQMKKDQENQLIKNNEKIWNLIKQNVLFEEIIQFVNKFEKLSFDFMKVIIEDLYIRKNTKDNIDAKFRLIQILIEKMNLEPKKSKEICECIARNISFILIDYLSSSFKPSELSKLYETLLYFREKVKNVYNDPKLDEKIYNSCANYEKFRNFMERKYFME